MPDGLWIGLLVFGILVLEFVPLIIWRVKSKRVFQWMFHNKTIVLNAAQGSAKLFVDGALTDEISGSISVCTLKAYIEGTEVRVRVRFGFRIQAEATAEGTPLTAI